MVKPSSAPQPKPRQLTPEPPKNTAPAVTEEEITEAKEEIKVQKPKSSVAASNSDQVNMIIDLFDGKIIN